jgi:uncharacterized protein
MSELERFRKQKDHFFKSDPHSPLTLEQKREFKGLSYFPEDPELNLQAALVEFQQKDKIQMQTSTGDFQEYVRYGKLKFTVNGQPLELTVYANEQGYFLPFVDSQAGKETYGAGRYLEPQPLGPGHFQVDFNYAYNPFCAYNDRWSCPLTPVENRLKAPIRAGEQIFEAHL